MKVLFVFGTRPEAIKLAPVFLELSDRPSFDCKICVTGQHREMLAQVLELFELRPDWDLDLMRPNQDLAYLTGAVLSGVGEVLDALRPDRVIVQGDTTTTFAGALAAKDRIVTADQVVARAPDLIIGSWCGKKFRPERVATRAGFGQIPAVRDQALYEIKSSLILQPGPAALTDGLAELQRTIERWATRP
jgi:ABC-type hemin transport system substrate-binding protein